MKTNYSLSRWGVGLATFMASGATHPMGAIPSVAHSKTLKQSFINSQLCDGEEFEVADWQDASLEEQTMIDSTRAHSREEQIVEARFVSDEATFVEAGDFISDFVAPESLLFPEIWGEYEAVVTLEIDDEDDLIPLDADSTDLEIFNV